MVKYSGVTCRTAPLVGVHSIFSTNAHFHFYWSTCQNYDLSFKGLLTKYRISSLSVGITDFHSSDVGLSWAVQNIRYESRAYVPAPGRCEIGVEGYIEAREAKKRDFRWGEEDDLDARWSYIEGGSCKYCLDILMSLFARTLCVPK